MRLAIECCGLPTIAHVRRADSMAAYLALVTDYVVIDPFGSFHIHDPSNGSPAALAAYRDGFLDLLVSRTFVPRDRASGYMSAGVRIDAQCALADGFADERGTWDCAEELARRLANGASMWSEPFVNSARRRVLRERAADRAGAVRLGRG